MQKIYMVKGGRALDAYETADGGHVSKAYARVDAWHGGAGPKCYTGRLSMSGSYAYVIEHVEKRLHDGYVIEAGSLKPDPAFCCEWCNGFGESTGQLTVKALEEALEGAKK